MEYNNDPALLEQPIINNSVDNEAFNYNQPLIRRNTLSTVNRNRLEDVTLRNQNREQMFKIWKQCWQYGLFDIYLILATLSP